MKKYLTLLLFLGSCVAALAQPLAQFDVQKKSLGRLRWHEAGEARFVIKNAGTSDLILRDVVPDCGCTTVSFPKTPLAPNSSAFIIVRYDSELLGHFQKGVAVYTNQSNEPAYLYVTGEVVMEQLRYEGTFDYHIGDIYLSTDNIEFDDVYRGDRPEQTLYIQNRGKIAYRPALMHLPKYLYAQAIPEVVQPGRTGRIVLKLNSRELGDVGLTTTSVYLARYEGDRVNATNELNVTAMLLPEQATTIADNAPKAEIDSVLHLGSFNGKRKLKGELTLKNTGRTPLDIRALQVYNPGISVALKSRTIPAGKEERIKITMSDATLRLQGSRRLLLITNDPTRPKIIITVSAKK